MQMPLDTHEKILSAYELLQGGTISVDTFEHVRTILKGFYPKVDEKLEICSKALDTLQKIQNADIITLSAERLSEDTEEKKKRKKALLFFIESLKDLQSEIKRVDTEFTQAQKHKNSSYNQLATWGRIVGHAKGPFGVVTLIALVSVVFVLPREHKTQNTAVVISNSTRIANSTPTINIASAVGQNSGCSQEGHIKSPSSYNKASITFDNQTTGVLQVYWIDFQGNRKFYSALKANSKYEQQTWIGHVWVVTNGTGQCLKLKSANAVQQLLVIN